MQHTKSKAIEIPEPPSYLKFINFALNSSTIERSDVGFGIVLSISTKGNDSTLFFQDQHFEIGNNNQTLVNLDLIGKTVSIVQVKTHKHCIVDSMEFHNGTKLFGKQAQELFDKVENFDTNILGTPNYEPDDTPANGYDISNYTNVTTFKDGACVNNSYYIIGGIKN